MAAGRLPDVEVDRHVALKGALLASVGFEVLKIVGTYTIAHTANSPTAGPFAGIIAVLVWIQLVSRCMLFSCAWIATVNAADPAGEQHPDHADATSEPDGAGARRRRRCGPATVGATLVGAGAIAGAVATWAATRPRDED